MKSSPRYKLFVLLFLGALSIPPGLCQGGGAQGGYRPVAVDMNINGYKPLAGQPAQAWVAARLDMNTESQNLLKAEWQNNFNQIALSLGPRWAKEVAKLGMPGRVSVKVTFASGRPAQLSVLQSSGNPAFDRTATDALMGAPGMPPPFPSGSKRKQVDSEWHFSYDVKQNSTTPLAKDDDWQMKGCIDAPDPGY